MARAFEPRLAVTRWRALSWQSLGGGVLAGGCSAGLAGQFLPWVAAWTAWCALLLGCVELATRLPAWRFRLLLGSSALAPLVFMAAWAPAAFAQRFSFLSWIGVTGPATSSPLPFSGVPLWLALGVPLLLLADLRLAPPPDELTTRCHARYWLPPLTLLTVGSASYSGWEDSVRWLFARPRVAAPLWDALIMAGPGTFAAVLTGSLALLSLAAARLSPCQPGGAHALTQVCAVVLSAWILAPALRLEPASARMALASGLPLIAAMIGLGLGDRAHAWAFREAEA